MTEQREARPARFRFEIPEAGDLEFRVANFSASEGISTPFQITLNLGCEDDVDFEEVVGKTGLLTVLSEDTDRFFHGIVNECTQGGRSGRFNLCRLVLVPSIWLLSLERDCRIFQDKTIPEILEQILQDRQITSDHYTFRLQRTYEARPYCVQYRESDLNFISRLLEEEGIFYFFEHDEEKHLLVFGDGTVNYQPIGGETEIEFHPADTRVPDREFVSSFSLSRQICPGKFSHTDFNFEQPSVDLMSEEQADNFDSLEVYDYPGEYKVQEAGQTLARIRLEEVSMLMDTGTGKGGCARFVPGFTFSLTDHEMDGFNQEYLLLDIRHLGSQPQALAEQSTAMDILYTNEFTAIPSSVVFRPHRDTPKPAVEGVQTAIVTGPDGEEIYTDEFGRVKVQFHWDRLGGRDEVSSCWIRVATLFAGGNYGAIFTPRIGQEVLVDFIEGDPDRPIITGRVYNADNMPPYALPGEKTKSTIKTNSSIGGDGFNEIRFEDKKGEEQLFVRAEKDLEIRAQNDHKMIVQNESHLVVQADQVEKVEGEKHLSVTGNHNEKIDGTISIEAGQDLQEKVGGKHALDAAQEIHLKAGMKVIVEGGTQVSLKVGGNFVDIGPAGVTIQGTMVNINSGGSAGSGSGCSPQSPREPLEADEAQAGRDPDYSAPQAQAMESAAQSGRPFCEQ